MRFLNFRLLGWVLLCNLFIFPFFHTADAKEEVNSPHSHVPLEAISDVLWADSLATFQKFLKTDPESARVELQNVSKKLFHGHLLTEEWVPLYFRIRHEGTEHPSDVKRLAELEIRMLTAIAMETRDFQKYALPLQRLQEAYQKYEDWENTQQNHSHSHETNHTPETKTGNSFRSTESRAETVESPSHKSEPDSKLLFERDIEAARAELVSRFAAEFNNHPLIEKMVDTTLAFAVKKEVTYPELIELTELQIQIMKSGGTEKHKEQIQEAEEGLRKLRNIRKLLEKQGSLGTETIKFHFDFERFLPGSQK